MDQKVPMRNIFVSRNCPCSQRRHTVLAVDDNIFNIMVLQHVLEEKFGIHSDKALNGLEALNKVAERHSDIVENPCVCGNINGNTNYRLIFMDCNMPIMDGFEATEKIAAFLEERGLREDTMISALTAFTNQSFKQRCLEAGMDRVLTKPIQNEEIASVL